MLLKKCTMGKHSSSHSLKLHFRYILLGLPPLLQLLCKAGENTPWLSRSCALQSSEDLFLIFEL